MSTGSAILVSAAMDERLYRLAREDALILTATRRLARTLTHEFDRRQLASGLTVWPQPAILPWRTWLEVAWQETFPERRLLTPAQSLALWEHAIAADPQTEAATLLRPDASARLASEANELAEAYGLPEASFTDTTPEHDAFQRWRDGYRARCRAGGWVDPARLVTEIDQALARGTLRPPRRVVLAGFHEVVPVERRLHRRLEERGSQLVTWEPARPARVCLRRYTADDPQHELRLVTSWIASAWKPTERVGVIVPDLQRRRASLEQVFAAELAPATVLELREAQMPFNISLGIPLTDEPMVAAALMILDAFVAPVRWEHAATLLQSPFFGEAESEWRGRAALEVTLRTSGRTVLQLAHLARSARALAPHTAGRLAALAAAAEHAAGSPRTPSAWAVAFADALAAGGWPGERPLVSREVQALAVWHEVLDALGGLDLHVGRIEGMGARNLLTRLCRARIFQPESSDAPIQVLGLFEAAGLHFDRLWVMGLDDETLPSPARPHPLLPVTLQRQCGVPRASPDGQLAFARALLDRLLTSAPDVALSASGAIDGRPTQPSRLVLTVPLRQPTWDRASRALMHTAYGSAELESVADAPPPPLAPGEPVLGGAQMLRDQAACPFRAFARHRLGARELDRPAPDLTAIQWGLLVHAALAALWDRLRDSATLQALDEATLQRHCEYASGVALTSLPGLSARHFARERLLQTLRGWMDRERQRTVPFAVIARELPLSIPVGPLTLRARLDRIDRLADGRYVVLDYKTGGVATTDWEGNRPRAPQLLLYAQGRDPLLPRVDGVAFARVAAGDHRFIGLAEGDGIAPGVTPFSASRYQRRTESSSWGALLEEWRRVIERLAGDFAAGIVSVDPAPNGNTSAVACARCPLPALCRIRAHAPNDGAEVR